MPLGFFILKICVYLKHMTFMILLLGNYNAVLSIFVHICIHTCADIHVS